MLEAVPLLAVTCCFLGLFAYYTITLEIDEVRKNWDRRRCEPSSILFAQKIPTDPSVDKDQFAEDNFYFCLEKLIDSTLKRTLQPVFDLFKKQVDAIQPIHDSIMNMKGSASGYLNPLNKTFNIMHDKFNAMSYQSARISVRIKMAMQRIQAILVSSMFAGLSMYQGIQNSIQLVIRICLIILGILIALIFFLWFVMFPFIPTILAVISAISIILGTAAVGGMASAFCVAPDTLVATSDSTWTPVCELKPGDLLRDGSMVEGILKTTGEGAKCVLLHGVHISACHLVFYDKKWIPADEHPFAIRSDTSPNELYCLNTTDRKWIVKSKDSSNELVLRDWEELPTNPIYDSIWESYIFKFLNPQKEYSLPESLPGRGLLHPDTLVYSKEKGPVSISSIQIGDTIKDKDDTFTKVIGLYEDISGPSKALWVFDTFWKHPTSSQNPCKIGVHLVTQSGSFLTSEFGYVRDFTEIGWDRIDASYSLTSSFLQEENS